MARIHQERAAAPRTPARPRTRRACRSKPRRAPDRPRGSPNSRCRSGRSAAAPSTSTRSGSSPISSCASRSAVATSSRSPASRAAARKGDLARVIVQVRRALGQQHGRAASCATIGTSTAAARGGSARSRKAVAGEFGRPGRRVGEARAQRVGARVVPQQPPGARPRPRARPASFAGRTARSNSAGGTVRTRRVARRRHENSPRTLAAPAPRRPAQAAAGLRPRELFLDPRRLAGALAQVVELGATHVAAALDLDARRSAASRSGTSARRPRRTRSCAR